MPNQNKNKNFKNNFENSFSKIIKENIIVFPVSVKNLFMFLISFIINLL